MKILFASDIHGSAYYCGKLLDCLLYTSDSAEDKARLDLVGRRIIKKNNL